MEQKEFTLDNPQQFITDMQALIDEQKALVRQLEEQFSEFKRQIRMKDAGVGFENEPVENLMVMDGVRVRFINCCHKNGIKTIADLLRTGMREFSRFRNAGRKTITFAREMLRKQYGVEWPYANASDSEEE